MGNYASKRKKVGYLELRESIPGSLVSDQDFDLFYSLCRIESVRTISTLLHPSSSQLFFVVVSGEVHIHLTSPDVKNKSTIAAVFKAGETIHFFNLAMKPGHNVPAFDFGECVRNGNIKLAMHFKSGPNSVARVIGIDRPAFDDFLVMAQNNTHTLNSFLGLTVSELPHKSPFFKTITADQMGTFGPLLKIRLSFVGKMVSPFTTEMAIQCQRIGTPLTPKAKKEPPAANYTPAGQISLLLSGTCLSVPYEANLTPIMQKLQDSVAKVPSTTPRTVGLGLNSGSKYASLSLPSFKKATHSAAQFSLSTLPPPIFHPTPPDPETSVNSIQSLGKFISQTKEVNVVDRSKMQVTMHPGTLMGLSEYFCRAPRVVPRASLASSPCVVGYLELSTLDALFAVDPRFERVVKRNYNMLMMAWLKPTVPLLRDMDEWSFALLSCKISIRCYLGGTLIYKKGDPSDFAYIMLCGSVKEVTESGSLKVTPTGGQKGLQIERIMNWGTLFGEVALVTNSPYFNTTTAQEPTMVLCISKHVLEQIYNNNKTKLCEIRIRLLGGDVGLHHVIDHPRGSVLFQTYLDKELAGESLRFYCAVDRYDSMCRDLKKQYNAVVKLREDNIELLSSGHVYNMQYLQNMVTTDNNDAHNDEQVVETVHNASFITLLSPHSVPRRRRGSNTSIGSVGNVVDSGVASGVDGGNDVISSIDAVHVEDSAYDNSVDLYLTQPDYTEHSILNDVQSPHSVHSVHSTHTTHNNIYTIPADPDTERSDPARNTTQAMYDSTHYTPDTFLPGNETHTVTTTITFPADTNTTHTNPTNPNDTTSPMHDSNATHDAFMPAYIIPSSTQSSFAYSSTKTSASNSSNKSMIPYMNSHSSGHNTKNNSVDMSAFSTEVNYTTTNAGYGNSYTNYTTNPSIVNTNATVTSNNTIHSTDTNHSLNTNYHFTDDTDTHSNKESVHSHGSVRSMDSNKSEHFLHSMQDANTNSTTLYEQLHATNTSTSTHTHTHHHNPYKLTHKPMLESIMSESNFSQTTDGEDGNSSVKFSVKQKPTPQGSISAGAYGYSSKIAPLMEHEEENEEDGAQSVTSGSAFTVANLKKAMQYATGLVEGGNSPSVGARGSPAVSPKHATVSPKHGSGGSPKHHTTTAANDTTSGGAGAGGSGRNSGRIVGGSGSTGSNSGSGAGGNENSATAGAGAGVNAGIAARVPLTLDTADNTANNTHANTSESAARTHSPERAQEVARSITQKLHRIQKNIVELKQVARTIMQVYIYNGAEAQLNLPDTLRIRTEQRFAHWSSSLLASVTSDAIGTTHPSATSTQPNTSTITTVNITSPLPTTNTTNTINATSFDLQDGSTRNGASKKNDSTDTTSNYVTYVHVPASINTTNTTNTTTSNPIHPTNTTNTNTTNNTHDTTTVTTTNPYNNTTNPYTTNIVRYDSIMSENTSGRSTAPHTGATHPQFRGSAVFYSTYNTNHDEGSGKMGMSGTISNSNSSRFIPAPIRIPTNSSVNFGSSDSVLSDGPVLLPASIHNTHGVHNSGAHGLYQHGYTHVHSGNTNTSTSITAANNTINYPNPTTHTNSTTHPTINTTNPTNPTNPTTTTTTTNNNTNTNNTTHAIPPLDIDLSFTDLFQEAKTEILKLLRDDKFPRFKNTPDFHAFIASIKPYEKEQNMDNSQNHSHIAPKSGKYRNSAEFDKSMEF